MKIFVLCDDHENIESVVFPNPALADKINMEVEKGGRVHKIDVDSRVITPEALRNATSVQARKRIYDKLSKLI